jgi:hypothetical protein
MDGHTIGLFQNNGTALIVRSAFSVQRSAEERLSQRVDCFQFCIANLTGFRHSVFLCKPVNQEGTADKIAVKPFTLEIHYHTSAYFDLNFGRHLETKKTKAGKDRL